MRRHEVTEALIADAAQRVIELGWCKPGQRVGITAGLPSGRPGTTSLFQVQQLEAHASDRRAIGAGAAAIVAPSHAADALDQAWQPFVLVAGLLLIGDAASRDGVFAAAGAWLERIPAGGAGLLAACLALVAVRPRC